MKKILLICMLLATIVTNVFALELEEVEQYTGKKVIVIIKQRPNMGHCGTIVKILASKEGKNFPSIVKAVLKWTTGDVSVIDLKHIEYIMKDIEKEE